MAEGKAKKTTKKAVGRPAKYTEALADKVCEKLGEGKSMRTVCRGAGMPDPATVYRWLGANEDFQKRYQWAKEQSADALTEEMLDIIDDSRNDFMEKFNKEGVSLGMVLDTENIRRSIARVETRKWLAEKLKPKRYGNNIALAITEAKEFSKERLDEVEAYLEANGVDTTKL